MAEQELTAKGKQEVTSEEYTRPGRTFAPDVDIFENADKLQLVADMPGVDEQSVEVHVEKGVLTIEGHVSLKDYENLTPVYTEYNVGNYARRFTLSSEIDTERIKARMKNGVLELELPKAEHAKPRRITVSAS